MKNPNVARRKLRAKDARKDGGMDTGKDPAEDASDTLASVHGDQFSEPSLGVSPSSSSSSSNLKLTSKPNGSDQSCLGEDFKSNEPQRDAQRASGFDAALEQVWGYYIVKLKKNPSLYTFTAKRRSKGMAALRRCYELAAEPRLENALHMMKMCVDRFANSSFHNGKNDSGKKFLDWELLFRNEEKLTYWLDDTNHELEARA